MVEEMVEESTEWSRTEYVKLDNRFREVFREPGVVDLVCRQTKQKIRRLNNPRRPRSNDHPLWRAYLSMVGSHSLRLHPTVSRKPGASINSQISMTRWVGDIVQQEIESIHDALEAHQEFGARQLLACLITPLNRYIDRIDEATAELCRLRKELEDGFCDGDTQIKRGREG